MSGNLLPLFPLQTVLLPRAPLPLHIFEDRYKEMVRDVQLADGEFGVVLARREGVLDTGCTARIDSITRQYEDGRMDLVAFGQRRFRIVSLNTERSYLRADIDEFEDDDATPAAEHTLRDAIRLYEQYSRDTGNEADAPENDEPLVSFVLGAISPDLDFRQMLLATRSEARRVEMVARHLAQLIQRHAREQAMRAQARTNGQSKHWKG